MSTSPAVVEHVIDVPDPTCAAVVNPVTPLGVRVICVPIPVAAVVLPTPEGVVPV